MRKNIVWAVVCLMVAIGLFACGGGGGGAGTNPTPNPVYTVTYKDNGMLNCTGFPILTCTYDTTGSVPTDTTPYEQGQTVVVSGNTGTLVRTGYVFTGWNTLSDGTGTTYAQAQTFAMGAVNVDLYAKWNDVTANAITAFSFTNPSTQGVIDEAAKTISVTVPYGTNVSALVATFATTGASVEVNSVAQVSGTTPNNFTSPRAYIAKAYDNSTALYTVTVTIAPRFKDNLDGTLTDAVTNLMWLKSPTYSDSWLNSMIYASNLGTAGHADWRLPTLVEFQSLTQGATGDVQAWLTAFGFTNVQWIYWTSTEYSDLNYAYTIQYVATATESNTRLKTQLGTVFAVRTAP